jgi:predicted nucleic acid-binding protein
VKAHIVLDSGFLIAAITRDDIFHEAAFFFFEELKVRKDSILVIVPPLVLYEVIVTLRRKGIKAEHIEKTVMRFVNLPYVSVLALSEMSAFKHAARSLNTVDQTNALRTHDFMIFCIAAEFSATIVTFDYKMLTKCRSVYASIYFPADVNGRTDETADILTEIDSNIGEDTNSLTYKALKTLIL